MASFCANCGNKLNEGERFCVICGYDTETPGGGDNYIRYDNQPSTGPQPSDRNQRLGDVLNHIYWFGIIWAFLALLGFVSCLSLYYILSTDMFPSLSDILSDAQMTNPLFIFGIKALLLVCGFACLISAIFAILCCIDINNLKNHQRACTFCLIGSVIALLSGAFGYGIIGIIFYFMMKKEGYRFSPSPASVAAGQGYGSSNYGIGQNKGFQPINQVPGYDGNMIIILVFGLIWGIGSFSSAYNYLTTSNPLFPEVVYVMWVMAALILISGVMAIICCYYIYKLEKHKSVCTLCLVGSILALPFGLIPGIVGIIFWTQLKERRYRFRS